MAKKDQYQNTASRLWDNVPISVDLRKKCLKSASLFTMMPGRAARKTGAVQRKRGVRSASDLLKMLFLYACSNISFCILATGAYALGISDISDTAWRKHFSKSSSFLYEILASLLLSFFPEAGVPASGKVKNVLLADASAVCQNGKKQEHY